jgi:hypothetical protein
VQRSWSVRSGSGHISWPLRVTWPAADAGSSRKGGSRASTRRTCDESPCPFPVTVGTPRTLSALAMPLNDVLPAARKAMMMGVTSRPFVGSLPGGLYRGRASLCRAVAVGWRRWSSSRSPHNRPRSAPRCRPSIRRPCAGTGYHVRSVPSRWPVRLRAPRRLRPIYLPARSDHIDRMPPRRSSPVVYMRCLCPRTALWTQGRGAVLRRQCVRVPPLLGFGLREPAGTSARTRDSDGAENPDAPGRR